MKYLYLLSLFSMLLCVTHERDVFAQGNAEIEASLSDSMDQFQLAAKKMRDELLTTLQDRVRKVAQKGNLDLVEDLLKQYRAYEIRQIIPADEGLLAAHRAYVLRVREELDAVLSQFDEKVKKETAKLSIEAAKSLREKRSAFEQKAIRDFLLTKKPAPEHGKTQIRLSDIRGMKVLRSYDNPRLSFRYECCDWDLPKEVKSIRIIHAARGEATPMNIPSTGSWYGIYLDEQGFFSLMGKDGGDGNGHAMILIKRHR